MKKNNNENALVVYGANGEIVSCNFQRIDVGQPRTILEYCNDEKQAISDILDSTAQLSIENDDTLTDELINSISSFGKTLDESEEQKEKNKKGIRKLLANIGLLKSQEEKLTYKALYNDYCEKIEEVRNAVATQLENTKNDVNLRQSIIEEMLPHIEQLEEKIKIGHIDMRSFEDHIEELKGQPQTQDLQYEIQYKTQILGILNSKLGELEKALVLYKQQVQSYRLQSGTDTELALRQESFLSNDSTILKSQGSILAWNRIQKNKISKAQALDKATNDAITSNAQELQSNAQAAVDLSVKGGITSDTIAQLQDALGKGVEIFKLGRKAKQEQVAKDRESLKKLNDALNEYQTELLNLAEVQNIQLEAIQSPSTKVKKIGQKTRKGNK